MNKIYCPTCGEGNLPLSKKCSNCGGNFIVGSKLKPSVQTKPQFTPKTQEIEKHEEKEEFFESDATVVPEFGGIEIEEFEVESNSVTLGELLNINKEKANIMNKPKSARKPRKSKV